MDAHYPFIICIGIAYFSATGRSQRLTSGSIVTGYPTQERAHVIWTQEHIDKVLETALFYMVRILIATTETNLRPADLVKQLHFNIEGLPLRKRRLRKRLAGTGAIRSYPNYSKNGRTGRDGTPVGQEPILTKGDDKALIKRYASQCLSAWKNETGLTKKALG